MSDQEARSAATKLGTVAKLACAKCRGEDILVRWHTHGGRYGEGGCGYYAKVIEYGEHLHYTCRTCQYEWIGAPADAK
jgi:hypothetical protein